MASFLPIAERNERPGLAGTRPRRGDKPPRLVLHTTEGRSLPAYSSPPHFTVGVGDPESMPALARGRVKFWQHVSLDRTAYALLHRRGTAETNHLGSHCVQIEIITCVGDNPAARIIGNRGHLPPVLLEAVANLIREILVKVPGIDPRTFPPPGRWSAVGSFGPLAPQRFTVREWEEFNGICGHQHVPGNAHWDPGALDIVGLVGLVTGNGAMSLRVAGLAGGAGPTARPDTGWPHIMKLSSRSPKVTVVRGLLQAMGYGTLGDSELYNAQVETAVAALQADEAISVDGRWGPETHGAVIARLEGGLARADLG
jgi:hypothetical protein